MSPVARGGGVRLPWAPPTSLSPAFDANTLATVSKAVQGRAWAQQGGAATTHTHHLSNHAHRVHAVSRYAPTPASTGVRDASSCIEGCVCVGGGQRGTQTGKSRGAADRRCFLGRRACPCLFQPARATRNAQCRRTCAGTGASGAGRGGGPARAPERRGSRCVEKRDKKSAGRFSSLARTPPLFRQARTARLPFLTTHNHAVAHSACVAPHEGHRVGRRRRRRG